MALIKRIALILISITALLLVFVEVVLRFVPLPGLTQAELNPKRGFENIQTVGHPYLAYAPKPGFTSKPDAARQRSHNSLGLRGKELSLHKPEGTFRIACLGGSSTYGSTPSSDAATWPARLEEHLKAARPDASIEVINGGNVGYSTFESVANLAFRLVEMEPDVVLVYHSINDARCALFKLGTPLPDNTHWRAIWPSYIASPMEGYLERSMSYLIWRRYATNYLEMTSDLGFYAIVGIPEDEGDRDAWYREDWFLDTNEIPEQGFRNFQRNLVSIIGIARSHGAKVVFGTQANDQSDYPQQTPSRENQLGAMQRMSDIIEAVATEREVLFVDAATVLEQEAARQLSDGGSEGIFTKEVHLTDEGAELLARTFAERLLAAGYVPE